MGPTMELIFIRHGEPRSETRTDGSAADPPLTDLGNRQAEAVAIALTQDSVDNIDALYCSPMRRARETAAPIAARLGLTAEYRDDLQEWGRNSGRYIGDADLRAAGPDDPDVARLRSGLADEHGYRFRAKVAAEVERIVSAHGGQRVLVVCHGGVINAYVSHILGTDKVLLFGPAHTSITRVLAQSSGMRSLHTANEHGHIKAI